MLLYGAAGAMKSWLSMHMGFCVATNNPWLGFPTTQARVLVINFEISSPSYHFRLQRMAQNFALENQALWELSSSYFFLDEGNNAEILADAIRPIAPNLIIFDCLSGCFGGDENSSRDMANFIRVISRIKDEHNASTIIVHHENKNLMVGSPVDRARGHSKLVGWADTILRLVVQPSTRQVQFGKVRHATRPLHPVNIEFQDYNWVVHGANPNLIVAREGGQA